MPYVNIFVETDDILEELSDDELMEELAHRKLTAESQHIDRFWQAYLLHVRGKPELCNAILHDIMLDAINRVV